MLDKKILLKEVLMEIKLQFEKSTLDANNLVKILEKNADDPTFQQVITDLYNRQSRLHATLFQLKLIINSQEQLQVELDKLEALDQDQAN